ncbi:MAG: T9SS type A sorting domain-containing protein [bacterium]|nr:T9SS type A sorting domain-containing protein [bacterium]
MRFRCQVGYNDVFQSWYIDDISVGNLSGLGYFDAFYKNNYIYIEWVYDALDDISGFNLYRREVSSDQGKNYQSMNTEWILINDEPITGNGRITFIDYSVQAGTEYEYRLEAVLPSGRVICGYHDCATVNEDETIPKAYSLTQNYPNPSSGTTTISFGLPDRASVSLKAYDLKGRCVARLISDREMAPGIYSADFDTSSLSDGLYLYRLKTPEYSAIKKMVVKH